MLRLAALICCGLMAAVVVTTAGANALPPPEQIRASGLKAVKYWINGGSPASSIPSKPGPMPLNLVPANKRRPVSVRSRPTELVSADCGWEDGTLMIGVATLQEATGDQALLDYLLGYGNKHSWQMCLRLGGAAWNPDNQIVAATYAQLLISSGSKNASWMIGAARAHLDAEIAANATTVKNWNWLDALFMAMSVYARVGAITGEQVYFDKMFANFHYSCLQHPGGHGFWSPSASLFYRDPPKGEGNGVFWSRGNGWAAAALVAAIKFSPADEPHVPVYMSVFKQHMQRLLQLQHADGCWRSSLNAPEFNPTPETTGTALFTYAMAFGIKQGLLDSASFLPAVERGWQCLSSVSLQPDGRLGYCQPVGAAPGVNFGPESSSSFCTGQFALAATAVAELAAAGH